MDIRDNFLDSIVEAVSRLRVFRCKKLDAEHQEEYNAEILKLDEKIWSVIEILRQ